MRELKFRAWDKQEKQMMKVSAISLENKEIGVKDFRTYHFFRIKNIELMQYTGLKDKNGTEIYEGDIVQYHPRHNGVPYRVYWANESAKFLIGRKGVVGQELSSVMYNLDTGRIALEVIGNIHENPELLERK